MNVPQNLKWIWENAISLFLTLFCGCKCNPHSMSYDAFNHVCVITGEHQQQWNPEIPEVCPSRQRLWAKVPAVWKGGCEWEGCPPVVCVSEGETPSALRWCHSSHDRSEVHYLESRVQEWHILELWEVPDLCWWGALQALQQAFPHHWHRGRH